MFGQALRRVVDGPGTADMVRAQRGLQVPLCDVAGLFQHNPVYRLLTGSKLTRRQAPGSARVSHTKLVYAELPKDKVLRLWRRLEGILSLQAYCRFWRSLYKRSNPCQPATCLKKREAARVLPYLLRIMGTQSPCYGPL